MTVHSAQDDSALLAYLQAEYAHPFSGWNFSYLDGRMVEDGSALTWDYRTSVEAHLPGIQALLDMDTGGGEFLASLKPLPGEICATEKYMPNVAVARRRLEPLGASVYGISDDSQLPLENDRFDLALNRHGSYSPREVFRVLKPGALFITEQIDGAQDNAELNHLLGAPAGQNWPHWQLPYAVKALEEAGFEIITRDEASPARRFYDVGAIVYYLKAIPWQINDFAVEKYFPRLKEAHERIQREGLIEVHSHLFFIIARKPL
jgi:SAM-dependent methyltransferase